MCIVRAVSNILIYLQLQEEEACAWQYNSPTIMSIAESVDEVHSDLADYLLAGEDCTDNNMFTFLEER